MHLRERWIFTIFNIGLWLPPVLMGLLLIIASRFNFLVSHTLAELLTIVISFVMFAFVWVTQDFRKNNFLIFLASGFLWVSLLDLTHLIVFEDMRFFVDGSGNLSVQFWIAARLLQAFVLLVAPFHTKHLRGGPYFFPLFGLISVGLALTILLGIFPAGFIEGVGHTDFKIYSEYAIILTLISALVALIKIGGGLQMYEKILISASILFMIFSELTFTTYVSDYGISNLTGHILKLFSFWLIFKAVFVYNVKRPFTELQRLKTSLDLTKDEVTMFWSDSLKFFYINQAAADAAGGPAESFYDSTPAAFYPGFEEDRFRKLVEPLVSKAKNALTFEASFTDSKGNLLPREVRLQFIEPIGGRPYFHSVTIDVTERYKAEKAKTEFVSTVSHELRTPLTSIGGVLGLMKAGAFDERPEKMHTMVNIAYKNVERLTSLIENLLDIDKIGAGGVHLPREAANINRLVEEAIEANESYTTERGITFKCSHKDLPLVADVNKGRIMQVMANLLSNAVKFSPPGSEVEVIVSRHDGNIRVAVKDYGYGIPEEAQATIFDRFTQVDSSDQRTEGGTGLGLNIAKSIVEAHGGTIGFTSELGKGSTFYFDLKESEVENKTLDGE